jgi:hypothetical protein
MSDTLPYCDENDDPIPSEIQDAVRAGEIYLIKERDIADEDYAKAKAAKADHLLVDGHDGKATLYDLQGHVIWSVTLD